MNTDKQEYVAKKATIENFLSALCAVGTFLIISWLIRYSAYGIDFTDESYYLVWMANPFIYDGSASQFGFIYHPLYWLLGGDIAALRQANVLITFALAWSLSYSFLASLTVDMKKSQITLLVISASLASSSCIIFASWLPTPNYNSLNLQALLIVATGLVLAEKNVDHKSVSGWLLIGIGSWLAFMAKPSSALLLAIGVFVYLIFVRNFSIRKLALTTITVLALLSISALLIDGSLVRFVNRLRLGFEFTQLLGGGHNLNQILRIGDFHTSARFKFLILLIFVTVFFAIWSMCTKKIKWQFFGLLISIGFFAITALLTLGRIDRVADLGKFQGLLIFSVVYAAVISALVLGRLQTLKSLATQQWMIAALFLAMPYIYAFGTGSNYWKVGSSAAIFWVLASLTLLGPLIRDRASLRLLLPLALSVQTVTATLIQTGLEQPYRQPSPLRFNASNLEIGLQGSALMLSDGYAEYISTAMAVAKKAGFEPNTALIDLSGQSPGILYALGAKSIGQAWTIGGYRGSLKLAEVALTHTSCEEIAVSWILFEQDGPRSIPSELMQSLGADFPNDFERVGTWQTAEGAGGFPDRRTQDLYRPLVQDKTRKNCQKLRDSPSVMSIPLILH